MSTLSEVPLGEQLRTLADQVERQVWQLGEDELREHYRALRTTIARLEERANTVLVRAGDDGSLLRDGARNDAHWVTCVGKVTPNEARAAVDVAGLTRRGRLPATTSAWIRGDLHAGHAAVIARTVLKLSAPGRDVAPETISEVEATLAEHATRWDPAYLARLARRIVAQVCPRRDEAADDPTTRSITLAQTMDGIGIVRGELDAEGYAILQTALNAFSPAPTDGDRLSAAQRRGQALIALAQAAMGTTATQGATTTLVLTMTLDDLVRQTGSATTEWGHDLSAGTVRRRACDARVLPVVLDGASQPLDVGREARTETPAIRRALAVRDGGCAFPGCDRPPAHTEAHHIEHWVHGGATSLDNMVLTCSIHHHDVHARGWEVELDDHGIPRFRPPAWIDATRTWRYHHRFAPPAAEAA